MPTFFVARAATHLLGVCSAVRLWLAGGNCARGSAAQSPRTAAATCWMERAGVMLVGCAARRAVARCAIRRSEVHSPWLRSREGAPVWSGLVFGTVDQFIWGARERRECQSAARLCPKCAKRLRHVGVILRASMLGFDRGDGHIRNGREALVPCFQVHSAVVLGNGAVDAKLWILAILVSRPATTPAGHMSVFWTLHHILNTPFGGGPSFHSIPFHSIATQIIKQQLQCLFLQAKQQGPERSYLFVPNRLR